MHINERIARYRKIEEKRKRPLIVYVTSTRVGLSAKMAGDSLREFIDQIDAIPPTQKEVDVLIHSAGGDGLAAWQLMSLLRGRFEKVYVLVPLTAFSAATLFALGADEIVMHPHASLGPIDPQVSARGADGKVVNFAYEDVGAFLRFVKSDIGLTEQAVVTAVVEKLFNTVNPLSIGGAKRASDLSTDMGARLLGTHMKDPEGRTQAKQIAENLNKSFFNHSDAITRDRACELKLKIAKGDPGLEALLWDAFLGIEEHMKLRQPFNPVTHYVTQVPDALSAPAAGPLLLPSNTPPPMAEQAWKIALTQALQNSAPKPDPEVTYDHVVAIVESVRVASEHRVKGRIRLRQIQDGVQVADTPSSAAWGPVDLQQADPKVVAGAAAPAQAPVAVTPPKGQDKAVEAGV